MAKNKPQIVGAVRVGGEVFTEGMEQELEKALQKSGASAESVRRLVEKGVIAGIELPDEEPEASGRNLGGDKSGEGSKAPDKSGKGNKSPDGDKTAGGAKDKDK